MKYLTRAVNFPLTHMDISDYIVALVAWISATGNEKYFQAKLFKLDMEIKKCNNINLQSNLNCKPAIFISWLIDL